MPPESQQTPAKILEELRDIIEQELQVVTYKWLARHCAISAALAKQLLYAFAEAHRGKVAATYFLSGWTSGGTGGSSGGGGDGISHNASKGKGSASEEPGSGHGVGGGASGRRHVAQLVDAARLEARKADLAQVTSLHVYSVQPAQPKDTAELWNTDQVQMEALFARLLRGGGGGDATDGGCVPGAVLSAVACEAAVRDPERDPRRAAGAQPPPEPSIAAKPKKPGPAEVLAALKTEVEQRGRGRQQPGGTEAKGAGEAAAPAANGIAKPLGNSRQPAASAKPANPGSKMAGMWSKAPPKRKQPASAPAAAQVAGDADAALRAAQQDDDGGSSSSGEDIAVAPRGRARGKRVVAALEDDSDGGEEAAQAAPSPAQAVEKAPPAANGKAARKAAGKGSKASAAKRGSKAAKAAGDGDAADGDEPAGAECAPEAQSAAKGKAKGKAAKAAPGHVKLGVETGGAVKRRKVMRTYYDDDGDEVTEMVWEDEVPAAEEAPAAGQPFAAAAVPGSDDAAPMETEAGAAEGEQLAKTRSGSPARAASSAKGSGLSDPAAAQKGGGKGSGAAKGSGGAKGGSGGIKKSGKGKAAPPNQRGIMSFFGKPK